MNTEDQQLRSSVRFDEAAGAAPENLMEFDTWGDFSLIAEHLEKTDLVTLPAGFAVEVKRRIQQEQRRRDLLLVLQTGCVTALILTCVAATALGFDWWERLVRVLQPDAIANYWTRFSGSLPVAHFDLRTLYTHLTPFLQLLPGAFLAAAVAALLLELAIFRLLRIGPFQLKGNQPGNSTT